MDGASNITGIANALKEIAKAEQANGTNPYESPLVAVVVEQLAYLVRGVDKDKAYSKVHDLYEALPKEENNDPS